MANPETTPATPEQIRAAREQYGSDDIEVDDNATISEVSPPADGSPDGLWVQAWVWLAPDDDDD